MQAQRVQEQERGQPVLPLVASVSAMQAAVRAEIEANDLSQTAVARELGVSPATLSQWLNGRYKGDNQGVAQTAGAWLDQRRRRQAIRSVAPRTKEWVKTPTSSRILSALEFAQAAGDLVVTYGVPGSGKTTTINHFSNTRPNAWAVTATAATRSATAILAELAEVVGGVSAPYHAAKLQRALTRRLHGTEGILVVDEAQHLSPEALESLRGLHDVTGIGLALVGNERVYARLTGGSRQEYFAQLFSRIGKRVDIKRVTEKDVLAIASAWGVTAEAAAVLVPIGQSPGALREVSKTLRLASIVAASEGERVTADHLRAAHRNRGGVA